MATPKKSASTPRPPKAGEKGFGMKPLPAGTNQKPVKGRPVNPKSDINQVGLVQQRQTRPAKKGESLGQENERKLRDMRVDRDGKPFAK